VKKSTKVKIYAERLEKLEEELSAVSKRKKRLNVLVLVLRNRIKTLMTQRTEGYSNISRIYTTEERSWDGLIDYLIAHGRAMLPKVLTIKH